MPPSSSSQYLRNRRYVPYIVPAHVSQVASPPNPLHQASPPSLSEHEHHEDSTTAPDPKLAATSEVILAGCRRIADATRRMEAMNDKMCREARRILPDHFTDPPQPEMLSGPNLPEGQTPLPSERKAETPYDTSASALVSQAARILMKRRNYKARIPDGPPAHLLGPTTKDYFYEWFEDVRSPWNSCSREILVDYVLAAFPDDTSEKDRPTIEKAAIAHLHVLREVYMASKLPQELEILAKRHQRIQRKREKLNRRLEVVRHPEFSILHNHASVYETLGVDGMSSEEDCPGPCPPGKESTRLVFRKAYLSSDLSNLNAHVDSIHEKRWGPRPYLRSPPIPKACSRWILNLPRNIYDRSALASLKSHQRASLRVRPDHALKFHTGAI